MAVKPLPCSQLPGSYSPLALASIAIFLSCVQEGRGARENPQAKSPGAPHKCLICKSPRGL